MKWLIPLLLAGCAAVALEEPGELYKCHQLGQYLICAPERATAVA
jgi:hypothetical protein